MDSATERPSSARRKAELEYQKCLLQTASLMRMRTGQPETKMDELAFKRVNHQLEQLNKE